MIVIPFLQYISRIEEFDMVIKRDGRTGKDSVLIFRNIRIQNDAFVFP